MYTDSVRERSSGYRSQNYGRQDEGSLQGRKVKQGSGCPEITLCVAAIIMILGAVVLRCESDSHDPIRVREAAQIFTYSLVTGVALFILSFFCKCAEETYERDMGYRE